MVGFQANSFSSRCTQGETSVIGSADPFNRKEQATFHLTSYCFQLSFRVRFFETNTCLDIGRTYGKTR